MPKPRIPLNVLRLKGAVAASPNRYKERLNEPVPQPLGEPPEHLTEAETACWRELVKAAPDGVMGACDSWELEIACCLVAQYREDRQKMPASRLGLLHSVLGRFGFNPCDRSKVQVKPAEPDNRFDDW